MASWLKNFTRWLRSWVLLIPALLWALIPSGMILAILLKYSKSADWWKWLAPTWATCSVILIIFMLIQVHKAQEPRRNSSVAQCLLSLSATFVIGFPSIVIGGMPLIDPNGTLLAQKLASDLTVNISPQPKEPIEHTTTFVIGIDVSKSFLDSNNANLEMVKDVLHSLFDSKGPIGQSIRETDTLQLRFFAGRSNIADSSTSREQPGLNVSNRRGILEKIYSYRKSSEVASENGIALSEDGKNIQGFLTQVSSEASCGEDDRLRIIIFSDLNHEKKVVDGKIRDQSKIVLDFMSVAAAFENKNCDTSIVAFSSTSQSIVRPGYEILKHKDVSEALRGNSRRNFRWQDISINEYVDRLNSEDRAEADGARWGLPWALYNDIEVIRTLPVATSSTEEGEAETSTIVIPKNFPNSKFFLALEGQPPSQDFFLKFNVHTGEDDDFSLNADKTNCYSWCPTPLSPNLKLVATGNESFVEGKYAVILSSPSLSRASRIMVESIDIRNKEFIFTLNLTFILLSIIPFGIVAFIARDAACRNKADRSFDAVHSSGHEGDL